MNALTERQRGTCSFTGKPYDCHLCETHKTLEGVNFHMTMSVSGPLLNNNTEIWKKLSGFFIECGEFMTWQMVRDSYRLLACLGVDTLPMCDCKKFCFKKGCMKPEKVRK